MNAQEFILNKYQLSGNGCISIPNVGRMHIAQLFGELGMKEGAEIGVEAGLYSECLFKYNPGLHLYLVDPWEWLPHRYWVPRHRVDRFMREVAGRLEGLNYTIIRKFSADAVKDFPDNSLDFVYIDGDHRYEATKHDIVEWTKKVRPGGLLSGHDFINRKGESTHNVVKAVLEYVQEAGIQTWFLWGSKSKAPGEYRDDARSWMWMKP
jgi:hypothetical protein